MYKIMVLFLSLILSFSLFSSEDFKDILAKRIEKEHTKAIVDYRISRTYLFGELHLKKDNTLDDVYCSMNFTSKDGVGSKKIPNPEVVNCEHTWPQSKFSKNFPSHIQKNDLHHLFPSYSKANTSRSNNPFGYVALIEKKVPNCPQSKRGFLSENNNLGFEPPDNHKGNVARALFYFSLRYKMTIADNLEKTYREWHLLDPVDELELKRTLRIKEIQGNSNPFITNPEYVERVEDF